MEYQLSDSVLKFIQQCSKQIGEYENDCFDQKLWNECLDLNMESPIEQILYCAIKTIARLNAIGEADPIRINGKDFLSGIDIIIQKVIGHYRVDFEVSYGFLTHENKTTNQNFRQVIVECDSQEFHERSEKERRYEKKRDRYLSLKGYHVFHYTGKEILENPLKIAIEIVSYVTGWKEEDLNGLD